MTIVRPGQSLIQHYGWDVAPRDPFTIGAAIVTAASASTGVVLGYGAFVVASYVIGTVAVGGIIAGAQYALNKTLTDKAGSGIGRSGVGAVNSAESRGNIRQSAPIQRIAYGGPLRMGGAVSFFDDSKPPYFYLQLLHSARPIAQVSTARIGTKVIRFADVTPDTILVPLPFDTPDYSNFLRMAFGQGLPSQTMCPLLDATFPNLDSSFRQQGVARTTWEFRRSSNVPTDEALWGPGAPIPSPFIDIEYGAPVYDPRDPAQRYPEDWRDAADVASAMATWKASRNASLIQADWLGWPDGMAHPIDRLRMDEIGRAADFDDEIIGNADGSFRKRHEISGVVTLDQSPRDVMEAMGTANRGFVVVERGRGWVSSSQPREPVLTITEELLAGAFTFRDDRPKTDHVNSITSKFSSADREYQDTDGPPRIDEDLIEQDGEELPMNLRYPFTEDHRAVQQLNKAHMDASRLGRALQMPLKMRANRAKLGDCVRVDFKHYTRCNGLYSVEEKGIILAGRPALQFSLAEYSPTLPIDWRYQVDEQPFTLPPLNVS